MRRLLLSLLLCTLAAGSAAEVPSPQEFLGYGIGERFTPHHRILDWFEALDTSSELVTLERFGESWEHRPLFFAVITSAANQDALGDIQRRIAAIQDAGATSPSEAERIAAETPVVVWLAFGVHGNESSSSEAAMLTAHWLATSEEARPLLDRAVVLVEPVENPDGRERYVSWYRERLGSEPDPERDAAEHYEPWPGGRYNHYLVDLNRDWAWITQIETRARVAAFRRWNPQVFVDFHEMSPESSYFFPPVALPLNANLDPEITEWLQTFGRANAAVFSERLWPFFVSETFDLFYPGYGDAWPSLRGAVGMTYEMAGGGRAGLAWRRNDDTILTLADRAERHLTAAQSTVRTAVTHAGDLIRYNYRALRRQIEADDLVFLLGAGGRHFDQALDLLDRQGIRIESLKAPVRLRATRITDRAAETAEFAPGTAVIRTRQPLGALARTLLEQNPILPESFIQDQRAKVEADEPAEFYDLTGWSVPVSHNLDAWTTTSPLPADALGPRPIRPAVLFREARYAWLLPATDPGFYRAAGRLLEEEVKFSVASEGLRLDGGTRHSRGTLVILRGGNREELGETLQGISASTGASFVPIDQGWTGGTPLGSQTIRFVVPPSIGILGGEGTSSTSFGSLWYAFDVETGIPHTILPLQRFGSIDLSNYDVLIFPDGSRYAEILGKGGIDKLKRWTREGGTIVAIGRGAAFLREKEIEISSVKTDPAPADEEDKENEPTEKRYTDYQIPGAAFRTSINERSYLTFGFERAPSVLIEGSTALLPVEHKVDNIVRLEEKDPLVSGFVWPESLERFKGSAYLVTERFGRGKVITFAHEPFFRDFWRGTLPLLLNAALYSPSL
ncbi:MAG TPA: M14 family zinc carboxypeptidase [Thermoanaerobaculia bacterium]|nr:M14 family zinc carboxypeptidase [Thermoanaerobaculia bacterium]